MVAPMDVFIPPLEPDIEFVRLPKTEKTFGMTFEIKRDAMAQHIIPRWGWDEDQQLQIHRKHFDAKPFYRIDREGRCVGVVSVFATSDHVRLGEFYLVGDFRGKGLGTRILRHCLSYADEIGLPVRLEYLKWNPVGHLYLRHGFSVISENDIHYFLERPVASVTRDVADPV